MLNYSIYMKLIVSYSYIINFGNPGAVLCNMGGVKFHPLFKVM